MDDELNIEPPEEAFDDGLMDEPDENFLDGELPESAFADQTEDEAAVAGGSFVDENDPAGTVPAAGAAACNDPVFASVDEWVRYWLLPVWVRPHGDGKGHRWCPKWWLHPEAYLILDALWRGWEMARRMPGNGIESYLTYYFYPLMRELTADQGPFSRCKAPSDTHPQGEHGQHLVGMLYAEPVPITRELEADWSQQLTVSDVEGRLAREIPGA